MTPEEITDDRLEGWKKKLSANKATPLALIGVGIEGEHKGRVILCIPEITNGVGLTDPQIATLLRKTAQDLMRGRN